MNSVEWINSVYLLQNVVFRVVICIFDEKLITWTEGISSESQNFPVTNMIVLLNSTNVWFAIAYVRSYNRTLIRMHGFKRPQVMNKIIFQIEHGNIKFHLSNQCGNQIIIWNFLNCWYQGRKKQKNSLSIYMQYGRHCVQYTQMVLSRTLLIYKYVVVNFLVSAGYVCRVDFWTKYSTIKRRQQQ